MPTRDVGEGKGQQFVGVRVRAIGLVILVVLMIGALPGLAPRAGAEPRTFTVAIHDLEPFVMTAGTIKSGFTIEVLEAVAKRADWTLRYVDEKSVDAQLDAVARGRADAAATAIEITAARARDVDFSQPVLNAGMQILVPSSQLERSLPGLAVFLELLFSKTMLTWLTAALVLSVIPAHIIWLSERRHKSPMVPRSYFRGVIRSFGWSLGMLAGQPPEFPRHSMARALGVLWAFVGIIFVAYYTATLTANVTVEKFDAKINTPSDLVGKRVCTVGDTQSSSYLTSIGVRFEAVADIDDCYTALTGGEVDAVVFDSPVLRYYAAHEGVGVGQVVGTIFEPEDYGVAFANDSPLTEEFNQGLLSIREDGSYDLIKQKWFGFEVSNSGGTGS